MQRLKVVLLEPCHEDVTLVYLKRDQMTFLHYRCGACADAHMASDC